MAKGISQEQVNQAADSLLLAGERPTIERIRAVLGTGSPNTVNRFLDEWWTGLGERLTQSRHKVAMPDAPSDVAACANQFWELELRMAQEQATAELAQEQQSLADERTALQTTKTELQAANSQAQLAREAALQAAEAATVRLADLQRFVDQQALQLKEFGTQRDRALSDLSATQADLLKMQSELRLHQSAWSQERNTLESTHLAMQDRWLGEVDRARQDEAKTVSKLKQVEHASELSARKAAEQIADLSKRLLHSEKEEAKKATRVSSLEEEIKRLHMQLKAQRQVKPSGVSRPIKMAKKTS